MAKFVLAMFKSDGTRRDFQLTKDSTIIGRKVNCDLRIPLTSVSRQHCEIVVEGDKVQIKDLGSSNGTYHNNVRVQDAFLSAGDELSIGPVVFTLIVDGQPADLKPVRTIVSGDDAADGHGGQLGSSSSDAERVDADLDIPEIVEEDDGTSPTLELDDDPVAALESLGNAGSDDSDEFDDIDFFEIEDEEDSR